MCDDLQVAFETTLYRVFLGDDSHLLKIGAPCPEPVANWISHHAGSHCGWLITACNPDARQIDEALNRAREGLLREWANARAIAWLETINEDADRQWPDEPGVLVVGIEEGVVRAMMRRFGQAATVVVPVAAPVQLVWSGARRAGQPLT